MQEVAPLLDRLPVKQEAELLQQPSNRHAQRHPRVLQHKVDGVHDHVDGVHDRVEDPVKAVDYQVKGEVDSIDNGFA